MTRGAHRNRRARVALLVGALLLGTGLAWMLSAAWGVAPRDAFIAGSADVTGLTIGTVIVLLSLVLVMGGALGLGTIALLVVLPPVLGWMTPRFHNWVHSLHDQEQASHVAMGGASGK